MYNSLIFIQNIEDRTFLAVKFPEFKINKKYCCTLRIMDDDTEAFGGATLRTWNDPENSIKLLKTDADYEVSFFMLWKLGHKSPIKATTTRSILKTIYKDKPLFRTAEFWTVERLRGTAQEEKVLSLDWEDICQKNENVIMRQLGKLIAKEDV